MGKRVQVREVTNDERQAVARLAHSRTAPVRAVERARVIQAALDGVTVEQTAVQLGLARNTVYLWLKRFQTRGLAGLEEYAAAWSGVPPTYTREQVGEIVATALTDPQTLGQPFQSWTLDRLVVYLSEQKGIGMKRSRVNAVLLTEGLRWRQQETWFGERFDPDFATKKGAIEALYVSPPKGSVVVCLDEMGPEAAKSWPGQRVVETAPQPPPTPRPAGRARQEIDYGRREKGYVFGAFRPATGDAFTVPYPGRTIANWVDFLERVDGWLPTEAERVYAVLDNLSTHRAVDVLLFQLTHPRWEFVFPPTYAAYLNLIEPWWKILRSLALNGRRFECWAEICQAIDAATAYWQAHQHPFVWGRRRRHHPRRQPGIALKPAVA